MKYYPYEPADRSPSSQSSYEWDPDTMDHEQLIRRTSWDRRQLMRQKTQIELDLVTGRRFDEEDFLRQLRQLAQISHDMLMCEFMLHCARRWPSEADD
ncbi:uncharacterized protein BKA55DRAFT_592137 [Fusarium redolens]|uniref:Uncharacterized protein n=1 Tax=Fusarium redolens TaxID=48865 RepID=A0A9P9KMQ4_FUSRE|nr:uncharacterized protein BKA55DRAFT_592137 [Fusarium redolens]KAH7259394.1 hypothetical protein BKA55DRAFT_592137 [Fusarium redolens]